MESEEINDECTCNGKCHCDDNCHCNCCECDASEEEVYKSPYPNIPRVDFNVNDFNDWD